MFVIPLIKLMKETANPNDRRPSDSKFRELAVRTTLLSMGPCISTIIFLQTVMWTDYGTLLVGIDCIVNVCCMMLMSKRLYNDCCFKTLCVLPLCLFKFMSSRKENEKMVALTPKAIVSAA